MPTCAELVAERLRDRMTDVRMLLAAIEHPEDYGQAFTDRFGYEPKDARRAADEMPLGCWRSTPLRCYVLQLSTGGPGDQFEFVEHRAKRYRYLDWFDGAAVDLTRAQSQAVTRLWGEFDRLAHRTAYRDGLRRCP